MKDKLEEKVKKPKGGLWKGLWKTKKLDKSNIVAVLYLRESGIAEPMEVKSEKGFFNINGKSYHERRDCIYTIDKERYPLAIIPEWSVTPIGKKEWYDKSLQEVCSILQDHVMKGIRHAERVRSGENMRDSKLTTKQMVDGGIIVIILEAFLFSYI